jgi:hypothetical protein
MATLSNPTFEIDLLTGMPDMATVIATVNVELEPLDTFLIAGGLGLELRSELRGEDGGLNGTDENLYYFPSQNITSGGTYTFEATVSLGTLNEDRGLFNGGDEVYNSFNLVSTSNIFPLNTQLSSPVIEGSFG